MLKALVACSTFAVSVVTLCAATLQAPNGRVRMAANPGGSPGEVVSIRIGKKWVPVLSSDAAATRIVPLGSRNPPEACTVKTAKLVSGALAVRGNCGAFGSFEQRVRLTEEPDVLAVAVKFLLPYNAKINSVADRYDFAPGQRAADDPAGPVDFVWSQNIKNEKDGDIPQWAFKSPVVMLQQGPVFAALMPTLNDKRSVPLALDLDVTSQKLPWLAYGAIPSEPYGHSYFRRSSTGSPDIVPVTRAFAPSQGVIQYRYSIVASDQPYKQGFRRAVRLLWKNEGRKELMRSDDLQQNVTRPQIVAFQQWAQDTWIRYANSVYFSFQCGDKLCGTLAQFRNPWGKWAQNPGPDAWFNPWFEALRTAYGWYLYGQRTNNKQIERKAESVLNLILLSPRDGGAFSTIYLFKTKKWQHSDGWAGFGNDYHSFGMSWTGYWMLKWAEDLTPDRKPEVLAFLRPYGDFLLKQQLSSGVIPSWYNAKLQPNPVFRTFNAETAASALFLAKLSQATGNNAYLTAAEKAMDFIAREVLPRQRWFDFETFLSCARKPFSFYDPWTAQDPQNNLAEIQAANAYLELYKTTKQPKYLHVGTRVLDHLLLTQQVWNNPAFSPKLVGGFTTQDTDAEWSDAREAYAAVTLWRYYQATGRGEYLERSVAAARSTFAVAPWENWAHTGYINGSGALTGINWGAGSGMTSIEMMAPTLGDAYVNLKKKNGVCFNACSMQYLEIRGDQIFFSLQAVPQIHTLHVRFADVDKSVQYRIVVNGKESSLISGATLAREGYMFTR